MPNKVTCALKMRLFYQVLALDALTDKYVSDGVHNEMFCQISSSVQNHLIPSVAAFTAEARSSSPVDNRSRKSSTIAR